MYFQDFWYFLQFLIFFVYENCKIFIFPSILLRPHNNLRLVVLIWFDFLILINFCPLPSPPTVFVPCRKLKALEEATDPWGGVPHWPLRPWPMVAVPSILTRTPIPMWSSTPSPSTWRDGAWQTNPLQTSPKQEPTQRGLQLRYDLLSHFQIHSWNTRSGH